MIGSDQTTGGRVFVGICRVELHLPAAQSLKDKRAVVQSLTTRLRNRFPIAVAEVDALDRHQLAVIGLASVANEAHHAQETLNAAVRYVEESRLDADLVAIELDVIPAF